MKKRFWLFLLLVAVMLISIQALAQDGFYVVGGGGAVGTKITSAPYTITTPGFYYLGKNLDGTIDIHSDHVTLDLMGFTITGSGAGSGYGVSIGGSSPMKNVEVRNGTIREFVYGIAAFFTSPPEMCHKIINVRVIDNIDFGIYMPGSGHIIKGCTAYANGGTGIRCSNSLLINNVSTLNGTNVSGTGNTLVDNRF